MTTTKLTKEGFYWMRLSPELDWCIARITIRNMPEVTHINDGKVPHYCAFGNNYSIPCPLDAEYTGPIEKPRK